MQAYSVYVGCNIARISYAPVIDALASTPKPSSHLSRYALYNGTRYVHCKLAPGALIELSAYIIYSVQLHPSAGLHCICRVQHYVYVVRPSDMEVEKTLNIYFWKSRTIFLDDEILGRESRPRFTSLYCILASYVQCNVVAPAIYNTM